MLLLRFDRSCSPVSVWQFASVVVLVWQFASVACQCGSVSVAAAMTVWRIAGWSHLRAICALLCSALPSGGLAGTSPMAQLSDSRRTADRGDHYRVYCQDQEIPENWADMRQRLGKGERLLSQNPKRNWQEVEIRFCEEPGYSVRSAWSWLRLSNRQSWQFFQTLCSRSS